MAIHTRFLSILEEHSKPPRQQPEKMDERYITSIIGQNLPMNRIII